MRFGAVFLEILVDFVSAPVEEISAPVHSASREVIRGKVVLEEGSKGCRQVEEGQISGYPAHQLAAWPKEYSYIVCNISSVNSLYKQNINIRYKTHKYTHKSQLSHVKSTVLHPPGMSNSIMTLTPRLRAYSTSAFTSDREYFSALE